MYLFSAFPLDLADLSRTLLPLTALHGLFFVYKFQSLYDIDVSVIRMADPDLAFHVTVLVTVGHAVEELNKEDGGDRSFILISNSESDICKKVTAERMKKINSSFVLLD